MSNRRFIWFRYSTSSTVNNFLSFPVDTASSLVRRNILLSLNPKSRNRSRRERFFSHSERTCIGLFFENRVISLLYSRFMIFFLQKRKNQITFLIQTNDFDKNRKWKEKSTISKLKSR